MIQTWFFFDGLYGYWMMGVPLDSFSSHTSKAWPQKDRITYPLCWGDAKMSQYSLAWLLGWPAKICTPCWVELLGTSTVAPRTE